MELLWLIVIVLAALVWRLYRRLRMLEQQAQELLAASRTDSLDEAQIAALTRRLWNLETLWRGKFEGPAESHAISATPAPSPDIATESVSPYRRVGYSHEDEATEHPSESILRTAPTEPDALPVTEAPLERSAEIKASAVSSVSQPAVPVRPPAPSAPIKVSAFAMWRRRMREQMAGEEWEETVGGNWLNKVGMIVLIIGLALFLGYSLKYFGPGGRIAVGLMVSGAILTGGVILERRMRYVIFARGLIGGGWAALYLTIYAAHGLEASRVVDDPVMGMALLILVAAGMILHSLRYRSEVVTGLAYFLGFAAIAISPASVFSAVALVPLAGSLLYVARRFAWPSMAVFGVVSTYAILAANYGTADSGPDKFLMAQSVLAICWLLFEAFDLLDLRLRGERPSPMLAIFPLNACGFVGVSLLYWPSAATADLYIFFGAAGAAYLASAFLRAGVRPPKAFPAEATTLARMVIGGYESAITVAVILASIGIGFKFSGHDINIALLLEAELLFLAGLRLAQPYLRVLAVAVMTLALVKLGIMDLNLPKPEHVAVLGLALQAWTPIALLTAAICYMNRWLARDPRKSLLHTAELGYGYAATLVIVFVARIETPVEYNGLVWLILSLPLFEVGLRKGFEDFRIQSYIAGTLGLAVLGHVNIEGFGVDPGRDAWTTLGPAALLLYGGAIRLFRLSAERLPDGERLSAMNVLLTAGTALAAALAWYVLPQPLVALAWGGLSLVLIEAGFLVPLAILRLLGSIVATLAFGRLFFANFTNMGETSGVSHRILTVVPLMALFYYLWARFREEGAKGGFARWEHATSRLYLYAPMILAVILIRFELGRALAVVGWATLGIVLLFAGRRMDNRDLRLQSYALALLTFARCWATNFYIPESFAVELGRIGTGSVVAVSFYVSQFLSPRRAEDAAAAASSGRWFTRVLAWFELNARDMFSTLATGLLALLLFYEVSGNLLTVAWAIEGVIVLAAGFAMHERVMRLTGLLLLAVCILKVFVYDFRELEAVFRILSFVVLGLLLIGVSLVYSRYRDQLRRYL